MPVTDTTTYAYLRDDVAPTDNVIKVMPFEAPKFAGFSKLAIEAGGGVVEIVSIDSRDEANGTFTVTRGSNPVRASAWGTRVYAVFAGGGGGGGGSAYIADDGGEPSESPPSATAYGALAMGVGTEATAKYAHAEGYFSKATGPGAHAEGGFYWESAYYTYKPGGEASAGATHAEGYYTVASGIGAHAEGANSEASYYFAHAEGVGTTASGLGSHAEGRSTSATESAAHAEGQQTEAYGASSHAEGSATLASAYMAHAEGFNSTASGSKSHAEGDRTTASGDYSHSEGGGTEAYGYCSHSEGRYTKAYGNYSHAGGYHGYAPTDHAWARGGGETTSGTIGQDVRQPISQYTSDDTAEYAGPGLDVGGYYSAVSFFGRLAAVDETNGYAAAWEVSGLAHDGGGGVSLDGYNVNQTQYTGTANNWSITLGIYNGKVTPKVTGAAGTPIHWGGYIAGGQVRPAPS